MEITLTSISYNVRLMHY